MFRDLHRHAYTLKCTQLWVCSTSLTHLSTPASATLAVLHGFCSGAAQPWALGIASPLSPCAQPAHSGSSEHRGSSEPRPSLPWARIRAQPSCYGPLSSGAFITGSHETGDKPRNSPQPLLMGQLEPSPREKKECLWLGQGASQQGLAGKPGSHPICSASQPCSCPPSLCCKARAPCPARAGWQLSRGAGTARGEAGGARRL